MLVISIWLSMTPPGIQTFSLPPPPPIKSQMCHNPFESCEFLSLWHLLSQKHFLLCQAEMLDLLVREGGKEVMDVAAVCFLPMQLKLRHISTPQKQASC